VVVHHLLPTGRMQRRESPDGLRSGSCGSGDIHIASSVVTIPALGVKDSQMSAGAPGKENYWWDP